MRAVNQVAKLAGISVRTLHYYDDIGLLEPTATTPAGYRQYSDNDLEKLWQIMFYKELDFPLEEIKRILGNPNYNKQDALKKHRQLLTQKKKRLEELIASIDKSIEKGFDVNMLKTFDMKDFEAHKKQYAEEAAQKYGDAYIKSNEKTSKYSKEQWEIIMKEAQSIYEELADNMDKDVDSPIVQELIEKWRKHINQNYYECTLEIFKGLGEMYVADVRFTKNIDKTKVGLAAFIKKAIDYYCEVNG